jgi:transcriptional regulator with XRE-family HTH domain
MSKASISRWKAGGSPTNSSKRKIADYFGVTIAELNGTTEKPAPQTERELTDLERSLVEDIMKLPDDLKRLVVAQIKAWQQTD